MVSYDILALLEENYKGIGDNNYSDFLGPLVYDSSIPCNTIVDPLPHTCVGKEIFSVINEEWINPFVA